ncbi:DUF4357 domain-containing protein [Streptomyces sp. NPDC058947]|uniref:restriction system modified-DNA reader domain-containing protein n=1 Tax=Streptomyces sp. NPDC058947 TaxID=3346675 RepID=UPI0036B17F3D
MTVLNIHLEPEVLAHLSRAGSTDVINISISLGAKPVKPAPVTTKPSGPLADLMEAGLLKAGEELAFYQRRAKRTGRATVTSDGQLIVEGRTKAFSSPSKAAEAVTGNVINGWTLWRTEGGKGPTLDELRNRL